MDWENYIGYILKSEVADWIQDSRCADQFDNQNHDPDTDDPTDARLFRSVVFLRSNISISIRLPSRHPEFINGFRERQPYEDLPNAKSYFDTFDFLWCGRAILSQLAIGYSNDETQCILPASMDVTPEQKRIFRLINMVDNWERRDLPACERDYERNFKLCGRRIVSHPWPSTLRA